ncbi:MAG TPA: hypothetical protein VGM88_32820 [Kofleriaceae bacterium]|jgi:hypothetical protein
MKLAALVVLLAACGSSGYSGDAKIEYQGATYEPNDGYVFFSGTTMLLSFGTASSACGVAFDSDLTQGLPPPGQYAQIRVSSVNTGTYSDTQMAIVDMGDNLAVDSLSGPVTITAADGGAVTGAVNVVQPDVDGGIGITGTFTVTVCTQ